MNNGYSPVNNGIIPFWLLGGDIFS